MSTTKDQPGTATPVQGEEAKEEASSKAKPTPRPDILDFEFVEATRPQVNLKLRNILSCS